MGSCILMVNDHVMYPCVCCGFLTLGEQPPGTFLICPVCDWEDDDVQAGNPTLHRGANTVSLEEARRNFAEFGAISKDALGRVRPPRPAEVPAGGTT